MNKLNLKIITPEKEALSEEVDEVVVTTGNGEIGILPHHVNLLTKIIPGEMRIKTGGKIKLFATGAGILQVTGNTVSVLTDLAEDAEHIDEKAVEDARKRAQAALEQTLSDEEFADTLAALERSLAQLKVKRRHQVR